MNLRDAQAAQTRQRLIDGMKALMSRKDYEAIRISDIARAAGVSVGTFYLYFKTKTDIVTHIVRGLNEELTRDLAVLPDEPAEAQYMRYCNRYLATILRDGFQFSRGIQIAMIQGAISPTDVSVERQRAYLAALAAHGAASGELICDGIDGQRFADMFLAAVNGSLLAWFFSSNDEAVLTTGMENVKRLFGLLKPGHRCEG